ncbi:GerMN domain-containing protein [Candidatus Parcubacteria bacterium]|nr:GerMN domain-containing protein [Candidatus Parcubacteria bacterium]
MNKIFTFLGIFILLAVIVTAGLMIIRGDEDTWLCVQGQWVQHGNPSSEMPTSTCPGFMPQEPDWVILNTPKENQFVSSPLLIEGKAKGTWFFEGSFPAKLYDEQGELLSVAIASSQGEWMTEDYVDFTAQMTFLVATTTQAKLVLERDNPSGLTELDKSVEFSLVLKPSETMDLQVFFNNNGLDPEVSCVKVFPVQRKVFKTLEPAKAAVEELLKGPTSNEASQSYSTNIPQDVKLNEIGIAKGVATVDFNEALGYQVGGSCRVSAIRAQITETLKQFPSVQDVVISINGQIEDILQP